MSPYTWLSTIGVRKRMHASKTRRRRSDPTAGLLGPESLELDGIRSQGALHVVTWRYDYSAATLALQARSRLCAVPIPISPTSNRRRSGDPYVRWLIKPPHAVR